jgi:hypothetical protein
MFVVFIKVDCNSYCFCTIDNMHSWKKKLFWSWKIYKNVTSKVSFFEHSFHKCLMVITFFPFSLNIARKLKPKLSLFLFFSDIMWYIYFLSFFLFYCLNKFSYALICQGGLEQFPNNVIYQRVITHAHSAIINIMLWHYKRWFHHYILTQFLFKIHYFLVFGFATKINYDKENEE